MMKKKKSLLFAVFMLFGASMTFGQINVSGRVVDDATNQTLPFVTVRVKGTSTGTVTTELGTFTLTIPSAESILEFMYVGFETLEVRAVADREIAVRLKPSAAELEAVVITGYQTIARERSTGAFSIVGQEKLENRLQGSAKSVLEGLTPGLVLTKDGNIEIRGVSTFLGDRRPLIIVDGFPLNVDYANLSTQGQSNVFNALSTGVNPLDFINPDNIESITTLKDAVAASIYGAQSANGVIIITTKSGNAAQKRGINNISYRGAFGVTLKPDLRQLQMASVDDYMDYEKDLFDRNPTAQFTNFNNYNKLSDHMYLLLAKDRRWDSAWDVSADAKIAQLRGNNALKEIEDHLMSSKVSQRHNFSLTSTTETNSIGVALGWYEERGHFRKITDENMRRLNVDLNNTWKPNKWLSVRLFSNFNYTTSHQPMVSHGFTSTTPANTVFNTLTASTPMLNSYNTLWRELTAFEFTSRILPYTRLYDDAGNPIWYYAGEQIKLDAYENTPGMKSWLYHPEDELKKTYIENDNMMIRIGGDVNTRFTDFLSATFGGTWSRGSVVGRGIYEGESFIMRTAFNDGTSDANPTNRHIPDGGKLDEVRATFGNWLIRAQLNYNQSFNNEMHRFTALAGAEVTQNTFENIFMPTRLGYDGVSASFNSGFNLLNYNNNVQIEDQPAFLGDFLHGRKPSYIGYLNPGANFSLRDRRAVSWYTNGSYEYNNRYVVSGSIRWELSNFFGTNPEYRYKPTWSIGGAYKMHEEEYFSDLTSIFSRFAPRISYGVLGSNSLNQTPYLILGVGSYSQMMGGISNSVSSYPNDQLRYERLTTFNLGVDMTMLNNRVNMTLDYYSNKSKDLLMTESVDPTRGIATLIQNVGEVTNTGFEIGATAHIVRQRDFRWSSTFVFSYNKSHVDRFQISGRTLSGFFSAQPTAVEGHSMDSYWGPSFAGLNHQGIPQWWSWRDTNNSGNIVLTKVADGALTIDDAHNLGVNRPPFDMSLTNTFRYKNFELSFMFICKLGGVYRESGFGGGNYTNHTVGQRWKNPGDENHTIYPVMGIWPWYFPYGDQLIRSSNFLKLRDLTVSYDLPRNVVSRAGLSGAKVYFQTRNLFYITAKGVNIDPEVMQINVTGGTSGLRQESFASNQLRPEFYFGIQINL